MTGDDRAQVGLSLANGFVVADPPVGGLPVFRNSATNEQIQTTTLAGAYRLSDRFQLGAEVPVVRRARAVSGVNYSKVGLGDLRASLGFELLPETYYSVWRPKGFAYLQLLAPGGKSIHDTTDPYQLDASSLGVWGLAAGVQFLKAWGSFDVLAAAQLQSFFAQSFRGPDGDFRLGAGWGGSFLVGAGYSPGGSDWRLGLSVGPSYQAAQSYSGARTGTVDEKLVWNPTFQLSWMPSSAWSLSASYTDQTLLGPVHNVLLTRSVAMSIQHRWEL
ncbi:MAG: hypothetical protein JST16_10160 [Bdellovibrionales bacterium]|nr:hypothetical protein [Bdellovibrionales bacterium]